MTCLRILIFLGCCFGLANSHAAMFQVDSAGSTAYFEVGYFGSGLVKGALAHITGSVEFDDASKSGVADISFDMNTVEAGRGFINNFIKSAQIFDTATYPTMRFHSRLFEFQDEQLVAVKGNLSLHGVTRAILMEVKRFACGDSIVAGEARHQCIGNFQTTILRSQFGMSSFSSVVNDEVKIAVELTLDRQQP